MTFPMIKGKDGHVNVYVGSNLYSIPPNHPQYKELLQAISENDSKTFLKLAVQQKPAEVVNRALGDKGIQVQGSRVFYKGTEIHNSVTARIVDHLRGGLPTEGLIKFLENLLENSSRRAVQELYNFLEHKGLPITDDGCFLAYKAVTESFLDKHSRTIDNSIGNVVEIERNEVDDDARQECSYGLHVGTQKYVRNFGSANYGDKFLLVKVNPKDCVAVPYHDSEKIRVCRYEVLAEATRDTILEKPLYSAPSNSYPEPIEEDVVDYDLECHEEEVCADCEECLDECVCEEVELPEGKEGEDAASLKDYIKRQFEHYMTSLNRDDVVTEAKDRGLIRTKEEGRKMGKEALCRLLAQKDAE